MNAASSASRTASTDGQTTAISSGGVPPRIEREHLLGDELERAADAGALEEPNRRRRAARGVGVVGEQRALEVRERRREELGRARRELDDVVAGERREVVGGAPQRRVHRAPRLVRQRDVHLGASGERLEQPPLGAGQVLEAVREAPGCRSRRRDRPSAARSRGGEARRGPTRRARSSSPR